MENKKRVIFKWLDRLLVKDADGNIGINCYPTNNKKDFKIIRNMDLSGMSSKEINKYFKSITFKDADGYYKLKIKL